MDIIELDIDDETMLRGWQDVGIAVNREVDPTFQPRAFETVRTAIVPPRSAYRLDLLAVEDGEVLGYGEIWHSVEDNLTTSCPSIEVKPQHRGRGVGSALLAEVERRIPANRTQLVGWISIPGDADVDSHPWVRWANKRGYAVSSRSIERHLAWPIDPALLDRLDPHVTEYRVETWLDGIPEQYRESYGILYGLVDAEAPTGDVAWEPSPISPQEYAEELAKHAANDDHTVETLALAGDEVVAFTTTSVPGDARRQMYVESTLVHREHRGHRLGMACKVANYRFLLEQAFTNPRICTENDDENPWMIQINKELGFVDALIGLAVKKNR